MPFLRCLQWRVFAKRVEDHIRVYTVAQYGDAPDDEVEKWTAEQCVLAIQKYTKRFGSNMRGEAESLRDMLKIAHFACLAYDKLGGDKQPIPLPGVAPEKKEGDYGYIPKPK